MSINTLFGDMAERLAEFIPEEEVIVSAKRNRLKIIRLNRDDQMYRRGIDATGDRILDGKYHPYTIEKKREQGQPYDRVTLRDTSAFHASMDIKFNKSSFEITANDLKYDDDTGEPVHLKEVYGDDILGLTDENLEFVARILVLPNMQDKLRAVLQKRK